MSSLLGLLFILAMLLVGGVIAAFCGFLIYKVFALLGWHTAGVVVLSIAGLVILFFVKKVFFGPFVASQSVMFGQPYPPNITTASKPQKENWLAQREKEEANWYQATWNSRNH